MSVTHAVPQALPTSVSGVWKMFPEMALLPLLAWLLLLALPHCPLAREALLAAGAEPWGLGAVRFTAVAIIGSYTYHGFVCAHHEQLAHLKIQDAQPYQFACGFIASRSTSVLLTELVYSALPLRPALGYSLTDWAWRIAFFILMKIFQDVWFFTVHFVVHQVPWLYARVHKLHHSIRSPNCFGAYYVTYYSHFLVEHIPITIASLTFAPGDVVVFYLYTGAFGFFLDHGGFHAGELGLPLSSVALGDFLSVLNFEGALLGGVQARTHDYHHERVNWNFALHYTFMDKLFGTFNDGRKPAGAGDKGAAVQD